MTAVRKTQGFSIQEIALLRCALDIRDSQALAMSKCDDGEKQFQLTVATQELADESTEDGVIKFSVELTASVKGLVDGVETWSAASTFVGTFSWKDGSEIGFESAMKVNGPAYLYGFAREHLADMTRRAGLFVMLPPIRMTPSDPEELEDEQEPAQEDATLE